MAATVEHLVGLQAQAALPPYLGLWSRLRGFDPHELGRMLTEREVVRLTLMRGTVHLVTPRDAALLRPLMQVAIERGHNGAFGRRMGGVEPDELATAARELLADGPLTAREAAQALVARGIGEDLEALGNAVRTYLPLVQLPPRGVWGAGGRARYATLQAWTGVELAAAPSIDDVVLRYLGAFGPATVKDAQNWSGLTKLAAVFERLRDRLVVFADEGGRELCDLPDAPRPGDVAAPARLLGEYDNVLLGHADRSRIRWSTACCARPGGSSPMRSPSVRSASWMSRTRSRRRRVPRSRSWARNATCASSRRSRRGRGRARAGGGGPSRRAAWCRAGP